MLTIRFKLGLLVILVACITASNGYKVPTYLNPLASFSSKSTSSPGHTATVLHVIEQRLDNFDIQNTDRFNQSYNVDDSFHVSGGPLFVVLAGDYSLDEYIFENLLMYDMASEENAVMFCLEQRYIGSSIPVANTSYENLKYFTPDQSLADTAHFVSHIKRIYGDGPVVIIGTQYGGSLAVWFHQKYPHLSSGVWASTAPLRAVVNMVDMKEAAGDIYREIGGVECYNHIANGFREMDELLAAGNIEELNNIFNPCNPLETPFAIWTFFYEMAELFLEPLIYGSITVERHCQYLGESAQSDAHRIARIMSPNWECMMTTPPEFFETLQNPALDFYPTALGFRQKFYQFCFQMGWFPTSGSDRQPFGSSFPIDLFYNQCELIFGSDFNSVALNENVDRLNVVYGGVNPDVNNVIFTQPEVDPWRGVAVQSDLNAFSPALTISNSGRSADFWRISSSNPAELMEAKIAIMQFVQALVR